jgi:hypothetical protein
MFMNVRLLERGPEKAQELELAVLAVAAVDIEPELSLCSIQG